jgi:hypothetical protein
MHGFFIGHHDDASVACLLLELCSGPNEPLRHAEEFMCVLPPDFLPLPFPDCETTYFVSRRAIQNLQKVHMLGITQSMPFELHHFVMKDDKVLLVDFSRAVAHQCGNATLVYNI